MNLNIDVDYVTICRPGHLNIKGLVLDVDDVGISIEVPADQGSIYRASVDRAYKAFIPWIAITEVRY